MDFGYLERFAAGDRLLLVEVLTLFCEAAPALDAGLAGDTPSMALHTLKGSARGIGADELGDLCEIAEKGGGTALVRDGLSRTIAAIELYLAAMPAG